MHAAADYHGVEGMRDTDQVITTRELARWAKAAGIDWNALEDSAYDSLMGKASGAGVIFGNTGGVMEAALRTAYSYLTGKEAPEALLQFTPVRGYEGAREAQVEIGDLSLRVAVVYGTANARNFLQRMQESGKQYHFVEVMACPGGCNRRRRTAQGPDEGRRRDPQEPYCRPLSAGRLHDPSYQSRKP